MSTPDPATTDWVPLAGGVGVPTGGTAGQVLAKNSSTSYDASWTSRNGSLILSPGSAILPDGSSGNAAPALTRRQGSESNPKKHFLTLDFDAATAEYAWWTFAVPSRYVAGGPVTLTLLWQANATSGSAVWAARVGAVTAGDADTVTEHALAAASSTTTATNTTEARRLNLTSIALANLDNLNPGDLLTLVIYRDAAAGGDTLTVDAELVSAILEYA